VNKVSLYGTWWGLCRHTSPMKMYFPKGRNFRKYILVSIIEVIFIIYLLDVWLVYTDNPQGKGITVAQFDKYLNVKSTRS
jgi:hypothetical protein